MEFLKRFNISDECIQKINDIYPDAILSNFKMNEDNVIKIIIYLQDNQIKDIETILLNCIDLFMKPATKVIAKLEENPDYLGQIQENTIDWNSLF